MGRDQSTARGQTGRGRQLYGSDHPMASPDDQGMSEVALVGKFGPEPVHGPYLRIIDQLKISLLPYRHQWIHPDVQNVPSLGIPSQFREKGWQFWPLDLQDHIGLNHFGGAPGTSVHGQARRQVHGKNKGTVDIDMIDQPTNPKFGLSI